MTVLTPTVASVNRELRARLGAVVDDILVARATAIRLFRRRQGQTPELAFTDVRLLDEPITSQDVKQLLAALRFVRRHTGRLGQTVQDASYPALQAELLYRERFSLLGLGVELEHGLMEFAAKLEAAGSGTSTVQRLYGSSFEFGHIAEIGRL